MENRFKRLRYNDDLCFHKKYTMDELAEKLEISKATISHLEASEDYDARVSVLKRYKEAFPDISYDYLLGAKNTRNNEYSELEHLLPLGDRFYETLKKLFHYENEYSDDLEPEMRQTVIDFENEMQKRTESMLESIFSDANRLSHFLSDTYKSLFNIYLLEHGIDDPSHPCSSEDKLAFEWYNFTQTTMDFFKTIVYECMQHAFEAELEAAKKRKQTLTENQETKIKERLNSLNINSNTAPFD